MKYAFSKSYDQFLCLEVEADSLEAAHGFPEYMWVKDAEKLLLGKSIIKCRYMTRMEQDELMWNHRPLVIALHDGTLLYSPRDDEGNDAGAMFAGPHVFGVMR